MNRGETRRAIFETVQEMRYFLACVVRAIRGGEIELHAFALMINHFHMLVRSPVGRLSEALQRIQSRYVRWFNRRRRRDGSRLRGRFRSIPAGSLVYRRYLVRYIDDNPVRAGLAARAEDYVYCSARAYSQRRRPVWLSRDWIEAEVGKPFSYASYRSRFPTRLSEGERKWIATRLSRGGYVADPLDLLVGAPPGEVERWLLDDQDSRPFPLIPVDALEPALAQSGEKTLTAGLLRQVAGLTYAEISQRMQCAKTTVHALARRYRHQLREDPIYAANAANLVVLCLTPFYSANSVQRG
jgi:REP element-mobilizing transposase RayT